MDSIPVIYDAGVFRPLGPVNLAEGTRAEVTPLVSNGIVDSTSAWPANYFDTTAGALDGEQFERPPQGEQPPREDW